jgi:hypothetical protein
METQFIRATLEIFFARLSPWRANDFCRNLTRAHLLRQNFLTCRRALKWKGLIARRHAKFNILFDPGRVRCPPTCVVRHWIDRRTLALGVK